MPVQVLLDARVTARGHTGIARYVRELARRLPERGVKLDALLPRGASLEGTRAVRARAPFLSPLEQLELPVRVAARRPEVFWVPAYDVPIAAPAPLVVTIHDANHLALPGPKAKLHALYYRAIVRTACQRARFVLVPSEFAKREVLERIGGATPEKIVVTRLGVHTPPRPDDETIAQAKKRLGLPERYVAYLGNFKPHKNIPALLEASLAFARDVPLLLVGGREEELGPSLSQARREGSRVLVIPSLSDAELWPVLAGASVFAFPSRYEGFGLPPLEAMALGVPVVSSTAGSLAELVQDAAETVDPDDAQGMGRAIAKVLSDAAHAAELAKKGLARSRSFTWERCADETAQVLRRAARG